MSAHLKVGPEIQRMNSADVAYGDFRNPEYAADILRRHSGWEIAVASTSPFSSFNP